MREATAPETQAGEQVGSTNAPMHEEAYARAQRWPGAAVAAAVVVGGLLAALRVEPQVWGDPGIWLSVGARLLEGDRLYADVFDNKDPLFFYSYAAALWLGGVRGPFVLEVLWLVVAASGMALALRALRVGTVGVLTGALVYPFALTATWYLPGATMIPALALAPVALWLWARDASFWAGVVLVVSILLKLNLALVVAAPLVALLLVGENGAYRRRKARNALSGVAAALLLATLVLAARGELRPYVETIFYNLHYSDAGVGGGGIRAHVEVVRVLFASAGRWQLPAASLSAVLLLVVSIVGWARLGLVFRRVSASALAALAAGLVTLALTAIFTVHVQLLAYPMALGAATVVVASRAVWRPLGAVTAAVVVLFAAWSSLKHEDIAGLSATRWTIAPLSTPGLALDGTRERLYPGEDRVTYAVFGRNTEDGHAAFADSSLDLRCRYFHQYPFYRAEQLDETIDCARRERPMLILVTTSFYDPMPDASWESFVAGTKSLLAERYDLVTEEGMSQVWRRR